MADVANIAVTKIADNDDFCTYQATMIHTGGAEDDITSQAMYVGFSDPFNKPGVVHVESIASTANSDVHIYIGGLFDNDLSAVAYGVLDTSLDIDGTGLNRVTAFGWRTNVNTLASSLILLSSEALCDYIVIKSDGQSSNPATTSNLVTIKVWKSAARKQVKGHVKDTA